MRLRAIPPEIAVQNPFENCKLKRKAYAKLLTSIIDNAEGGFTMALNNSWGTGKTTFVKMWQKYLENSEHQTVYVNAWEMDFISDPLYSILGEISSLVKYNKKNKEKIQANFEISSKFIIDWNKILCWHSFGRKSNKQSF